MQLRNLLLFFLFAGLLIGAYVARPYLFPPKPAPEQQEEAEVKPDPKPKSVEPKKGVDKPKDKPKPPDKETTKLEKKKGGKEATKARELVRRPLAEKKLIKLGSRDRNSPFHLQVVLDPPLAGVRSVLLNRFQQADERGLPVWDKDEEGKKSARPLMLVPPEANLSQPSHLLYHYGSADSNHPLDTLGQHQPRTPEPWKLVQKVVTEEDPNNSGRKRQRVSFQAETPEVLITKTYTLAEGEYHLGLEIKLERRTVGTNEVRFRYQLTGAQGLPVEGKWYTGTFRNALIGRVDGRNSVNRDLQDLRQVGHGEGGEEILRQGDYFLRYAGVAVQYFASVIVVDSDQPDQKFLRQARPTLERGILKGRFKGLDPKTRTITLVLEDKTTETLLVPDRFLGKFMGVPPEVDVAIVYRFDSYDPISKTTPRVALDVRGGAERDATHALWEDDVTVRVSTDEVVLTTEPVVHRYLLYNGPVKVSQLRQLKLDEALIARYHDDLRLDTLTDYQSPGWPGKIASSIYFTALLIKCTNLMHWVLGVLHQWVPNFGLCIVLLTVLVRGMMFPLSRKQAITGIKMQALAPEIKKLGEKYKDDRQALGAAQMELYRKNGVNPLGTCWMLFLQMPIFMGLYYALQESILFRLAPFWPTWVDNLGAPDMLFSWSKSIPMISRDSDFGSFLYLGPYVNILPVVAVVLMLGQQKMMTPPPADEQQAMQQKMMKYMMVVMGLMFYKVAAGLCLYFIASSLWGFAERQLLPKKKTEGATPDTGPTPGTSSNGTARAEPAPRMALPAPSSSTAITASAPPSGVVKEPTGVGRGKKSARNKRRGGGGREVPVAPPAPETRVGKFRQWLRVRRERLSEWWANVLEQARKK